MGEVAQRAQPHCPPPLLKRREALARLTKSNTRKAVQGCGKPDVFAACLGGEIGLVQAPIRKSEEGDLVIGSLPDGPEEVGKVMVHGTLRARWAGSRWMTPRPVRGFVAGEGGFRLLPLRRVCH